MTRDGGARLRHGWTTGACATAAAFRALLTGGFPDSVRIDLSNDRHPSFALSAERLEGRAATVGIVKDAGDDPDVTHGALVFARVVLGEPAINPMPRQFVREHVAAVAARHGGTGDVVVEISVEHGEELLYGLPDEALLDMGDFAGAVLEYLRRHPVPRLTVAGGIGKLAELADGHLDLASGRSQVSTESLAARLRAAGGSPELVEGVRHVDTALDALQPCRAAGLPLGALVAAGAQHTAVGRA